MRERLAFSFDLNKIQNCSFSQSFFLCISDIHAASWLPPWGIELLAFASRQFAPKIVDLSVLFIRILRERSEAPYCAIVHFILLYFRFFILRRMGKNKA